MSLVDAAQSLNLAPNSVRSRWKAGKIRGERDNTGKVWVWIDPTSKRDRSKPSSKVSTKASSEGDADTLRDVIGTLREELVQIRAERDQLAESASMADRLIGELDGLRAVNIEVSAERDRWRDQAQQLVAAIAPPAPEMAEQTRRGWWIFGRR
jgi:hypothetical protein